MKHSCCSHNAVSFSSFCSVRPIRRGYSEPQLPVRKWQRRRRSQRLDVVAPRWEKGRLKWAWIGFYDHGSVLTLKTETLKSLSRVVNVPPDWDPVLFGPGAGRVIMNGSKSCPDLARISCFSVELRSFCSSFLFRQVKWRLRKYQSRRRLGDVAVTPGSPPPPCSRVHSSTFAWM